MNLISIHPEAAAAAAAAAVKSIYPVATHISYLLTGHIVTYAYGSDSEKKSALLSSRNTLHALLVLLLLLLSLLGLPCFEIQDGLIQA